MAFQPLNSGNSPTTNYGQINDMIRQLNKEQTTKAFKQSGGNALIQGRYSDNRYGQVYYDSTNTPRILIGQAPDDGRMGIWVSKAGQSVLTLLGG